MEMIRHLEISNYKSIKHLKLEGCSRINVFVGRPNVGKSNILEALALDQLSDFLFQNQQYEADNKMSFKINLRNVLRVEEARGLFNFYHTNEPIELSFNGPLSGDYYPNLQILHEPGVDLYQWKRAQIDSITAFSNEFVPRAGKIFIPRINKDINSRVGFVSKIHYYSFNPNVFNESLYHNYGGYMDLLSPYGNNIIHVLESNRKLIEIISEIFKDTGFEFVMEKGRISDSEKTGFELNLKIQKRETKDIVIPFPYVSISDTLKRLIFYLSAIKSNHNNVVLFEEPEVHSFPSFISYLADEIIESNDNQFFIVTHNPYLLTELIENAPKGDTSVFVCGYDKENSQTTAKKLSDDDISELLDYGLDIFFNLNRYLDDGVKHST